MMIRMAVLVALMAGTAGLHASDDQSASICYGATGNGRLENGVKLPGSGDNFQSYSAVASMMGRTHVHDQVAEIILASYAFLAESHPSKVFMYAETGWRDGGSFEPHKTHQNGLSVDFMTPVINAEGQSVHLPTHALNRFGYDIEFDEQGQFGELSIDYDALGAHLVALHREAVERGHDLWRVIFDPALQPKLLATESGDYIRAHIQLSTRRSWVRHDEHYHVDFAVPCESL